MQPSDAVLRFAHTRAGRGDADADPSDDGTIREHQRRRGDAARVQTDMEAVLAIPPDEEEEEDRHAAPPGPAPSLVFVVFRGAKWEDPHGELRESDAIAEVHGTEEGARRAVARVTREDGDRLDAWYQPYALVE